MSFWGSGHLQLIVFWDWWRFEDDISWGQWHLGFEAVYTVDSNLALMRFRSWCQLRMMPFLELKLFAVDLVLGLILFRWQLQSGGCGHLQLKAFWGWCSLVWLQHPGIWTTPFSQMDRPDDVWSGKSSNFLSSILPSPSPSLFTSHPTISGSLLGILCLIPLSFLATSD